MTSWRDQVSPAARRQLDDLLNVGVAFAQDQLARHGEFFPFAVALPPQGDPELVAVSAESLGEHPAPAEVIEASVAALVDRRDELTAVGLVADVATDAGDAIRVELEHAEGVALAVLVPYAASEAGEEPEYGELRAQAGRRRVWPEA